MRIIQQKELKIKDKELKIEQSQSNLLLKENTLLLKQKQLKDSEYEAEQRVIQQLRRRRLKQLQNKNAQLQKQIETSRQFSQFEPYTRSQGNSADNSGWGLEQSQQMDVQSRANSRERSRLDQQSYIRIEQLHDRDGLDGETTRMQELVSPLSFNQAIHRE